MAFWETRKIGTPAEDVVGTAWCDRSRRARARLQKPDAQLYLRTLGLLPLLRTRRLYMHTKTGRDPGAAFSFPAAATRRGGRWGHPTQQKPSKIEPGRGRLTLSGIARPPFRARPLVTGTGGYPRDPPGAAPKARSLTDVSSPGKALKNPYLLSVKQPFCISVFTWPGISHEMVLELFYGRSVLFFEPDPFEGVLGPTLAENRPKTANN
jgi:hypothetical protein